MVEIDGRVQALLQAGAGFHPELSGRENVFLNGVILGLSRHEVKARYDAIVDLAGLDGVFMDTPVKHYSSGMYARLAFSVCSIRRPLMLPRTIQRSLAVCDERQLMDLAL